MSQVQSPLASHEELATYGWFAIKKNDTKSRTGGYFCGAQPRRATAHDRNLYWFLQARRVRCTG